MKIRPLLLALAASLITPSAIQASPVLFSPTVSYYYSGNLNWTYDNRIGSTFTTDEFNIPGADGMNLNVWGNSENVVDGTSGIISINYLPTTNMATGAVVSIGLTTTVKFTLSQAGEGTLTTNWSSLPSTITLTLNGAAVSAGNLVFNEGENTLSFSYDIFTMALSEDLSTSYSIEMTVVPEPESWALLACGAGGILLAARRKASSTRSTLES